MSARPLGLALTIHQPWGWLICAGHKDVENRTWPPGGEGRILVHAGKRTCREGAELAAALGVELPDELTVGAVIGEVTVAGAVTDSPSRWAFPDQWHWQLAGALLWDTPVPCRGHLGFFDVYPDGSTRPRGRGAL